MRSRGAGGVRQSQRGFVNRPSHQLPDRRPRRRCHGQRRRSFWRWRQYRSEAANTLATAGGVCVSAAAYDQVRKILPFAFDDLGTNQVKNMEEPIQAYSVGPLVAPATLAALKDRKPLILPNKPSIAVLPFQNM